ncbi:MAG: hypothetical protein ACLQFT_17915, partial [Steroidobacteraceae bacterium]
ITARSRDNFPNPKTRRDNPYAPTNSPALSDLWDAFHFNDGALPRAPGERRASRRAGRWQGGLRANYGGRSTTAS